MKKIVKIVVLSLVAFFAVSCGGNVADNNGRDAAGEEIPLSYSANLSLREHPGFLEAVIRNPWDTTKILHRYLLVSKDKDIPDNLPQGTVVRIPVSNALVYSSVHACLINDLGASDAVGGLCDAEYVKTDLFRKRIADGTLIDCGNGTTPDMEKIIKLHPDIIMLSPFENSNGYGKVEQLGIPIMECADYMETSPLGRAEWMKFYGILFGKKAEAEKKFKGIEERYNAVKRKMENVSTRPRILVDQRYGQVWNVPGGESTFGILIRDAGGENPFGGYKESGSVPLAPEKVLSEASDADIWLLRYYQPVDKTLSELASDAPVNSRFKAFKEGNVYGCNTAKVNYYEELPFNPDCLLEEIAGIIHPELAGKDFLTHYYHKLQN